MITVEGADMLGKSTLCDAIAAALGTALPKTLGLAVTQRHWTAEYGPHTLELTRTSLGLGLVRDRGWLSEVIYGSVFRGGPSITPEQAAEICGIERGHMGLNVVVWASDETYRRVLDVASTRGAAQPPAPRLVEVNRAYRTAALYGGAFGYGFRTHFSVEVRINNDGKTPTWPSSSPDLALSIAAAYAGKLAGMAGVARIWRNKL